MHPKEEDFEDSESPVPECLGFEMQDGLSTSSPAQPGPPSHTWPQTSAHTWPRRPARRPSTCSAPPGRRPVKGGLWGSPSPEVSCILGRGGLRWLLRWATRRRTRTKLVRPCSDFPSPSNRALPANPVGRLGLCIWSSVPQLIKD